MKKFVQFFAKGSIFKRDKNGRPCGVEDYRFGNGIVLHDSEMMGKVFGQCLDLLPCDRVVITTSPIG